MSREFGKIKTTLWGSRKFLALGPDSDARVLYFYLHTCPHGNAIGCFRLPKGYVLTDLQWSIKDFDRAIEALSVTDLIGWDEEESIVRIVSFLENSPITNAKHGAGAVKAALSLPDCEQKYIICNELAQLHFVDESVIKKELRKTSDRPIPTETETETETETLCSMEEGKTLSGMALGKRDD